MKLTVEVPAEFGGAIIGDISARRGEVLNFERQPEGTAAEVVAIVPMANLFDYADKARSLTQGRAAYSMEPLDYRPASEDVVNRIMHPEDYM